MLLDTIVLLWHITGAERLSRPAVRAIEREKCFYSYVSLLELALKNRLKKVQLTLRQRPVSARDFVLHVADKLQLGAINLEFDDLADVEHLPQLPRPDHNDPFDRLLVVQALWLPPKAAWDVLRNVQDGLVH